MRKLFIMVCAILLFFLSSIAAAAPVAPGDRLSYEGTLRGSVGFFIEAENATYLITAAHLAPGWRDGIEPAGEWSVRGQPIGKFYAWVPYSGGNAKDAMAIRIYPGVDVSNEIDGIQSLGIIEQRRGMEVVQRGFGGEPNYGTARGLPDTGINCNWNIDGVGPGHSGSMVMSVDPPAVLGLVRGGADWLVFGVQARWAIEALGFEDYHVVGGLPENTITIGDTVVRVDYFFAHPEEARARINEALAGDHAGVYIYTPYMLSIIFRR